MKYDRSDLKTMQSYSLDRKIMIAQTRIIEFYNKLNGNVYVSFSGGKDSTVLLDLARRIFPDIPAVYTDTGLEYPEIKKFVKSISNVEILRPNMSFREVIKQYGYPLIGKEVSQAIDEYRKNPEGCRKAYFDDDSDRNKKYKGMFSLSKYVYLRDSDIPISDKCCKIMKKQPFHDYEKRTGRKPILGTMACERHVRNTEWLKNGCNSFDSKRQTSKPLSIWTEQDILEYLKRFNIEYCPIYGDIEIDKNGKYFTTGAQRTGCVFCPLGAQREKEPNRFQKLKQTHPSLWEYCMKPWEDGGLGMKPILEFIGIKVE